MYGSNDTMISLVDLPILVLVGHAGVGKTNTAVGLALTMAAAGQRVSLADADVVNPYFRSSDYRTTLDDANIRVIAPAAAGTTLDTPSLTGELDVAIEQASRGELKLIIDVGGDDDGATAIGRWSGALTRAHAFVAYVISAFREPGSTEERVANALRYLHEIEAAAHLCVSGVLNTSNLGADTTVADVVTGRDFAYAVAKAAKLPLIATVIPAALAEQVNASVESAAGSEPIIPIARYVRAPWETL